MGGIRTRHVSEMVRHPACMSDPCSSHASASVTSRSGALATALEPAAAPAAPSAASATASAGAPSKRGARIKGGDGGSKGTGGRAADGGGGSEGADGWTADAHVRNSSGVGLRHGACMR